jgi:hypothetical protein
VGRIDLDFDGKLLLAEMEGCRRTLPHLQPRACKNACDNYV